MNSKLHLSKEHARELLEAKIKFGQLFRFDIQGNTVICRPLLISESELVVSFNEQLCDDVMEDWIIDRVVIYTTCPVDSLPAGIIPAMVSKILLYSNIKSEADFNKSVLNTRAKVETLQNTIEDIISKAYPSLTPDRIKNMTQYQQIHLLARAERITGNKLEISTGKKKRKSPIPVQEGFSAIDIVSKEAADIPDFERDNQGMR